MTVTSVLYLAVAAGSWPAFARRRYRVRVARHPITHERDVYVEVVHAAAEGAVCGVLWLPILVAGLTIRTGWRFARLLLGRTVAHDLTAARTARLEAELAAMDATPAVAARSNVIDLDRSRLRDQVKELRQLVAEAEMIKRQIGDLETVGANVDELRAALARKKERIELLAWEYDADRMRVAR